MSSNTTNPTSPYRSYATPPSTPSPSNLTHLTNPTSSSITPTPAPGPHRHPRRTSYNPSRSVPTLRREQSFYGEESELGDMVLSSAGFARIGNIPLATSGVEPGNEGLTESQLCQVGVRSGWMVAAVREDNGSQFTQGSDASQLFDSQQSQPIPRISTLNPYHLPSAPTIREGSSSRRHPSSPLFSGSPSRPGGRRGPLRSSTGANPSPRRSSARQSTSTALPGMLEDGEE